MLLSFFFPVDYDIDKRKQSLERMDLVDADVFEEGLCNGCWIKGRSKWFERERECDDACQRNVSMSGMSEGWYKSG